MPKVYNIRRKNVPEDAVYIGRGSEYGNPYRVGLGMGEYSRYESLELFEEYARKRLSKEPHWLDDLIGKDLLCYCAPQPCHGDVLLKLIAELEDRPTTT